MGSGKIRAMKINELNHALPPMQHSAPENPSVPPVVYQPVAPQRSDGEPGGGDDGASNACRESKIENQNSKIHHSAIPLLAAARAAFILLDRFEGQSRRKPPTLLTVFRLYCMQNFTVHQIARQCRCSAGTVSQRLRLIERKTGRPSKAFRSAWPPLKLELLGDT